jgi:hypothetical protein
LHKPADVLRGGRKLQRRPRLGAARGGTRRRHGRRRVARWRFLQRRSFVQQPPRKATARGITARGCVCFRAGNGVTYATRRLTSAFRASDPRRVRLERSRYERGGQLATAGLATRHGRQRSCTEHVGAYDRAPQVTSPRRRRKSVCRLLSLWSWRSPWSMPWVGNTGKRSASRSTPRMHERKEWSPFDDFYSGR